MFTVLLFSIDMFTFLITIITCFIRNVQHMSNHVQPCPKRFQISDNSFIPGIYLYARMIDMLGHIRVKNGVYIALDRVFSLIAHPRVMCKFLNMFCSIYI
jgi:hypothetical protein